MAETESEPFSLPVDSAPKIRALFDYWRAIHPESGLPGRARFDPVDVPELLANIWMVDVAREPLRFRFRLVGTEIVKFTDRDHTGRWLDEVYPGFADSSAYRFYRDCALAARPAYRRGQVPTRSGAKTVVAEQLTLPLAANGRDVDILLMMTLYGEAAEPSERYWDGMG